MKTRINTASLKRLALLEKKKKTRRPICLWPRVMGLKEWEAAAMPIQQRLLKENFSNDQKKTLFKKTVWLATT